MGVWLLWLRRSENEKTIEKRENFDMDGQSLYVHQLPV